MRHKLGNLNPIRAHRFQFRFSGYTLRLHAVSLVAAQSTALLMRVWVKEFFEIL